MIPYIIVPEEVNKSIIAKIISRKTIRNNSSVRSYELMCMTIL